MKNGMRSDSESQSCVKNTIAQLVLSQNAFKKILSSIVAAKRHPELQSSVLTARFQLVRISAARKRKRCSPLSFASHQVERHFHVM
ncbi:MAG: hypothetical protein ABQ298_05155 [Puniceicoccaceae bacterium]